MRKKVGLHVASVLVFAAAMAAVPAVSLPGKVWRVTLDLSGFSLVDEEAQPDGSAKKLVFEHDDGRINLTVVMKPVTAGGSASTVRDERWQRLQQIAPPEEDEKLWVEQGQAYFQYFTETPFQGAPLHQKHVHTFVVHDGTRIEVHVSVTRFTEKDEPWLDKFQRSIKITSGKA